MKKTAGLNFRYLYPLTFSSEAEFVFNKNIDGSVRFSFLAIPYKLTLLDALKLVYRFKIMLVMITANSAVQTSESSP